jgi:TRAP-type C4-dicarboxylate transport system substrate-binding protein
LDYTKISGGEPMRTKLLSIFFLIVTGWLMLFGVSSIKAASGEKIEMGLSYTQGPTSCVSFAMLKLKTMIEERSNGRISVTIYPSGQLYNPKSEVEAIAKGGLSMAPLHPAFVAARSPVLEFIGAIGAQGCWIDRDHYWRFIDLPEIREISEREMKAKVNAKLLTIISGGVGSICNSKRPIHTVKDYKGLRIRAAGSAESFFLKALGVVPINMSAGEVYMALQRGTVDGASSTIERFLNSKFYEVATYVTVDNSMPDITSPLAVNLDFWNKLSNTDQQILTESSLEIKKFTRTCVVQEAEDIYKKLKTGLVKDLFFMPKNEIQKINRIVQPVMRDLIKERAGKDIGEKLFELLLNTAEQK